MSKDEASSFSAASMFNLQDLPNEILVEILSFLTVQEAARTCVLSKRWKNLWKFVTRLNFEYCERVFHGPMIRDRYESLVDRVMSLHERTSLDEFRVICRRPLCCSSKLHAWMVDFLIPKGVKRIDINLASKCSSYCLRSLRDVHVLTSLTLNRVDISKPLLDGLLSNCQQLEYLSVSRSKRLINLKVSDPSLRLKHLSVSHCKSLKSIELSAPQLVKFQYVGRKIMFRNIRNNLKLSELIVGGPDPDAVICNLTHLSNLHPRLNTLKLYFDVSCRNDMKIPRFRQLRNLKTLILELEVMRCDDLVGFTKLIEAAPSLTRFTLDLSSVLWFSNTKEEAPEASHLPHKCLKIVEIFGFSGVCHHVGLVKYLLKNAVNLEKIVVGPPPREIWKREG